MATKSELTMSSFEHPIHMRALNLIAISIPEFPEYPLLYANTLKEIMTNRNCTQHAILKQK